MKKNILPGIYAFTASCLLLFSCQQESGGPADLTQVRTEIQAAEDAWAAALNDRDLEALMAMYADDAVSMPDNGPMLVGKDAIRTGQEQEFARTPAGLSFSFETLDVYAQGNTVTETGQSTYKDASGKIIGMGKYMCVWEKRGDKYLCIREIYNSNKASAPAAEKSIHLFDLPSDLSEAVWLDALNQLNGVIAELGYPGAGYHMYKTEGADIKNYRYYFEGVWPTAETYTTIHEDPAFTAAVDKLGPLYEKIKAVEIYRRMSHVR
jgi:uncharacterized protein (TIGR02246 family)